MQPAQCIQQRNRKNSLFETLLMLQATIKACFFFVGLCSMQTTPNKRVEWRPGLPPWPRCTHTHQWNSCYFLFPVFLFSVLFMLNAFWSLCGLHFVEPHSLHYAAKLRALLCCDDDDTDTNCDSNSSGTVATPQLRQSMQNNRKNSGQYSNRAA